MTGISAKETDAYFEKIDTMMGNLSRLIKQSDHKNRTYHPIISRLDQRKGDTGIIDMDFEFQKIAYNHGLKLGIRLSTIRERMGQYQCSKELQAWIHSEEP